MYASGFNLLSSSPFNPADIAGLVPVVKFSEPVSKDAQTIYDNAHFNSSAAEVNIMCFVYLLTC